MCAASPHPQPHHPHPRSSFFQQWHIATAMAAYFENDTVALPGCAKFFKVRRTMLECSLGRTRG